MKVIAIIQARMGSTRLPGKILKKVMGKTLLEYQLERVRQSKLIDEIIVATTVKESDREIVDLCNALGVRVYRGSEQDVLARYYEAAIENGAEVIVRLTSDCPLIDPEVISMVIKGFLEEKGGVDYVSNTLTRTFPRGLDIEVFSYGALEKSHLLGKDSNFREHVTAFMYNHPDMFKLKNILYHHDESNHRWTVDTIEDYYLVKRVIESLYPQNQRFLLKDVLTVLKENPEWVKLNAHIEQKKI